MSIGGRSTTPIPQPLLWQSLSPTSVPIDFGEFEIIEKLGQGGMGAVFRARDKTLKRTVALKILLDGRDADPIALARFEREGRSAAKLNHPNIVAIHRVGQHDGCAYIAMEFIEGETLSRQMDQVRFKEPAALRLAIDLAEALNYAHGLGVVHRDMKPENIIVGRDGRPRIADFGLAKDLDAQDTMTRTGTLMGTIPYMSPEQTRGEIQEADGRVDIYALGVILYELASGHLPFDGSTPFELMERIRRGDPLPPRKLNREISADYQTICLKAMSLEPAHRYPRAGDLADDLRRCLEGQPVLASPQTGAVRLWRRLRRQRRLLGWILSGLVIMGECAALGVSEQARTGMDMRVEQARRLMAEERTRRQRMHQQRSVDDALARRQRAIELNDRASDLAARGRDLGQVHRAIALHTEAIASDESYAASYLHRSRALFRAGRWADAGRDARSVLAMQELRQEAYYLRAWALIRQASELAFDERRSQLLQEVDALLLEMDRLWPRSAMTSTAQAYYALLSGTAFDGILPLLEHACSEDSAPAEAYLLRGALLGRYPHRGLERAGMAYFQYRARIYRPAAARDLITTYLDLEPFSRDGLLVLIHLDELDRNFVAARQHSDQLLASYNADPEALRLRLRFSFYLGDFASIERDAQGLGLLDPRPTALDADGDASGIILALTYYLTGRPREAIDFLRTHLAHQGRTAQTATKILLAAMLRAAGTTTDGLDGLSQDLQETLDADVILQSLRQLTALPPPLRASFLHGVQAQYDLFDRDVEGRGQALAARTLFQQVPVLAALLEEFFLTNRNLTAFLPLIELMGAPPLRPLQTAMLELGREIHMVRDLNLEEGLLALRFILMFGRERELELRQRLFSAEDCYFRACARYLQGRRQEAWQDLVAAREWNSRHLGACLGQALLRAEQGRTEAVLRHLTDAALLGFGDFERLRLDPAFAAVTHHPGFDRIASLSGERP